LFIKRYKEEKVLWECFSNLLGFCFFFNVCIVCLWIYHRMLVLGFKSIAVVSGPVQKQQHTGLRNEHHNTRSILFMAIKVTLCIPKGSGKTVWAT